LSVEAQSTRDQLKLDPQFLGRYGWTTQLPFKTTLVKSYSIRYQHK
jgi:hypothetical protein